MIKIPGNVLAVSLGLVMLATVPTGKAQAQGKAGARSYTADIKPVNDDLTAGQPRGTVQLDVQGDQLRITADVEGLPEGMRLMHYHGHPDGQEAQCPSAADDKNRDGVVDLIEAVGEAGETLVPFHEQPSNLSIKAKTYPEANAQGELKYEKTLRVSELSQAMQKKYGTEDLQLGKRVVVIHGVPKGITLPPTAQSLPGVPATTTVPIACGKIQPR